MKKVVILALLFFFYSASHVFATLGVGVGVGKISVDEKLKPGLFYKLPSITVINTGNESSDYQMAIEHQEAQPELIPEKNWFIFSPNNFRLEPGKVQKVEITLNLPVKTTPG